MSINTTQSATGPISTPHLWDPNLGLTKAVVAHVALLGNPFGYADAGPFLGHRHLQPTGTDQVSRAGTRHGTGLGR